MALPAGMKLFGDADSPLVQHVRRELVRALVMRDITCRQTGTLLDVDTCVVLVDRDGDPAYVLSQAGWAQIVAEGNDKPLEKNGGLVPDPATVKA